MSEKPEISDITFSLKKRDFNEGYNAGFNVGKAASRAEQRERYAQIMECLKHKYPDDQQELIMGWHNACTDGAAAIRGQDD